MKSVIVYFSQTGNTEKIAKAIQSGIQQSAVTCDIFNIKEADPACLSEYDLIGIGSPVQAWEPENVTNFINKMQGVSGKHIFIFCTHGLLPGAFFPHIYPTVTKQGLLVIGMRDWFGGVILSHCPKPYPSDGHPDEIDLNEAEAWGKTMVENSKRIKLGENDLIPKAPPVFEDEPMPMFVPPEFMYVLKDGKMKYHKEKCNYPKCHICMDNCPMDGIDLSTTPPRLCHPCLDCEFCTRVCPTGALEAYDFFEWITPPFYQHLRLYHNLWAEKEVQAGRFRRLVHPKDTGWKTSLTEITLQNVAKHPQWKAGKGLTIDSVVDEKK